MDTAKPFNDSHAAVEPTPYLQLMLPLRLGYLTPQGISVPGGSTASGRPVPIPDAPIWWIEPAAAFGPEQWEIALAIVRERRIPGIAGAGQLTDELLARIANLEHLTHLDLSACAGITDAGLRHLARLPRLQSLDLSCRHITDAGLAVLRQLPQLHRFLLRWHPQVSDTGFAHLETLEYLEDADLAGTTAGDGTIRALASKPRLQKLLLGTGVTDAGVALLHEYPMFKNAHDCVQSMELLSGTTGPNLLGLDLKAPLTNAGLANLAGLHGVRGLSFMNTGGQVLGAAHSPVTAAGLRCLEGLPNLSWLDCGGDLCNDEAMATVARLPGLRFLVCQDTVAGDAGFGALARSSSLEYIWGRRCYNLTNIGFKALSRMPRLGHLSVSCKNVDDSGLASLPDFPALVELMPMDIPDSGFAHVGKCRVLKTLLCMYCTDTTDEATAHLEGLAELQSYQAWSTQITDLSLQLLSRLTSLEHVRLEHCVQVTDDGIGALASLPRLREIQLSALPLVTPAALTAFAQGVSINYES